MPTWSRRNNVEPLNSNVELADNCRTRVATCIEAKKVHFFRTVALNEQIPFVFMLTLLEMATSLGNPAIYSNVGVLLHLSTACHTNPCRNVHGRFAACLSRFLHFVCKECGLIGNWNTRQECSEISKNTCSCLLLANSRSTLCITQAHL